MAIPDPNTTDWVPIWNPQNSGPKGDKGDQGIQGPIGPQGIQGIQGPKGDKGDKGDTGATGLPGATAPHHANHEPGGSDYLQNSVWLNLQNHFTDAQYIVNSGNASLYLMDMTSPVNLRVWRIMNQAQNLIFYTQDDGESGFVNQMNISHTGDVNVRGIMSAAAVRGTTIESRSASAPLFSVANAPVNQRTWGLYQANGDGNLFITAFNDAGVPQVHSATIYQNGVVVFPTNFTQHSQGIYLPIRSSNPQILDMYEEGTWTPTFYSLDGGAGISYISQGGAYTRIGSTVFVVYTLQLNAASWNTGSIVLGGFPFANANEYATGKMDYWSIVGGVMDLKLHMQPGANYAYMAYKAAVNGSGQDGTMAVGNITTASMIRGSMTYRTSA